jgi:hypothetical protein
MQRIGLWMAGAAVLLTAATIEAGDGYPMKCQAKPKPAPATGKAVPPCGYEAMVIFGGGMAFEQITGYCRQCRKFVCLRWTREGSPLLALGAEKVPRPKPLGEVWDAATGKVTAVYACPHCKGPFAEIKGPDELKHCPVCNEPHFKVDPSKARLAVD